MSRSDHELLFLIASADTAAFKELYFRYRNELFITASRVLRDEDEAADIVQEVFLSLWDRRNDLRIDGSLAAYLHTSIRYRCLNVIRKNIRRRDYLVQLAYSAPHSISDPDCRLQLKELQAAIDEALSAMPRKMRQAFLLSRHQLLTHREIAVKMGISHETVKKHIQSALRLLNHTLSSYIVHIFILIIFLVSTFP